ncbi:hypothetical protein BDW59DRAFT_154672 [Aspergillus cavernicola]|uniref:Zn(2)-C6 fungal-type domain-containing protein n=1 Tax=Aspergillus cavernicola TaxID=176166 RepID=A0ABR4HE64_9EURO
MVVVVQIMHLHLQGSNFLLPSSLFIGTYKRLILSIAKVPRFFMAPNKSPLQEASSKRTGRSRSRAGCARCRGRRQKCDETRPQCGRCHLVGANCSYMMNIRWGGRDFHRSRFGDCRVRRVGKLPLIRYKPFKIILYSTGELCQPDVKCSADRKDQTQPLGMNINQFPDLAPDQRDLIQYFTCQASAMISCHSQMQDETCQVLMSLSSGSTALLYSLLAFAAGHRASHTTDKVEERRLRLQMIQLKAKGMRDLQQEIALQLQSGVPLVASSLMLCLGSLCHEGDDYTSWRAHLRGAKAAFSTISAAELARNGSHSSYRCCGFRTP